MIETTNVILAMLGAAAVMAIAATALSSHLLRWLAAHCLLQAGALESYHDYRRVHMDGHMEACGVYAPQAEGENEPDGTERRDHTVRHTTQHD